MCYRMHDHDNVRTANRHAALSSDDRAEHRQRAFRHHAVRYGWLVAVCSIIWLVTGFGTTIPLWIMAIGGIRLVLHARHAYADTPEPDEPPALGAERFAEV